MIKNGAVLGWELVVFGSWLYGLWLCLAYTRRAFVLGAYLGTSITWGYDWIFGRSWMWNMSFHPDTTFWMLSWFGTKYALWAPLSYGAFFGAATFYTLKHRQWLDRHFGNWQYPLYFPLIFLMNIAVEGSAIHFFQVNIYHLPTQYLIFNIPWMHLLTTGTMFAVTVFLTHRAQDILLHAGWDDFASTASSEALSGAQRKLKTSILVLGLATPQLAFYLAMILGLSLYNALGLPTSDRPDCLINR